MAFSDLTVHSHFGFELGSPVCCPLDLTSDLLCVIFLPNTDGALLAGNRAVSNPVRIMSTVQATYSCEEFHCSLVGYKIVAPVPLTRECWIRDYTIHIT